MRVASPNIIVTSFLMGVVACENLGGLSSDAPPKSTKDAGGDDQSSSGASSSGSSSSSSGSTSSSSGDGGPVPVTATCDTTQPFGALDLQQDLDPSMKTQSAVMTDDELEIFYTRQAAEWELRHGRRTKRTDPWVVVTVPLTSPPIASLSLAQKGLALYYWRLSDAQPSTDEVYVATRASLAEDFGPPVLFPSGKGRIFLSNSDDGAYGFLSKQIGNVVNQFITYAPKTTGGLLAANVLPNLHEDGALDTMPVLNPSETIIYFQSNRPNPKYPDSGNIYTARRGSKLEDFSAAVLSVELSSASVDAVSWASDNDCDVLVQRSSHIYLASRPAK